ncbi:hypothetical protein B1F77_13635 [Pseudomonas syringae]|nr:hypothetical protein [Pseudomonas syringae]NAP50842.1 hypothetical protein [Pseudomonas syringae]NAP86826.1 hypothetical protein [Pseudomonas syringae]RXT76741.1 hypothetical protein B1F77_13635 [Pseudomonas syringae]RXT87282.1 hypothetical protein B1F72_03640 [Pseudomonas syringae]
MRRKRTRSVQSGIPTRSMGTIVFSLTTIVPHAPAWECSSRRSASQEDAERQTGIPTRSMGTMGI